MTLAASQALQTELLPALGRLRDSRANAFKVAQTRFDAGSSTTQDLERVRAEVESLWERLAELG